MTEQDACDGPEPGKLVVVDRRFGNQESPGGAVVRHAPDQGSHAPGALLRLAIERDLPLDKIDKLMSLQERWEANEARKAYVRAMSEFKAQDCPVITKDKSVRYKNVAYDHSSLAHVVEQCIAGLARHGMHHEWMADQTGGTIRVTCRITHRDGHYEDKSLCAGPDQSGTKNAIQAIASTVTYLERYTLLMALGLAPRDDDDGQAAGSPMAQQQTTQESPREQPAPHREQQGAPREQGAERETLSPRATRAIRVWAEYLGDNTREAMERFLGANAATWGEQHFELLLAAWRSVQQYEDRTVRAAELRIKIGQDHK